MKKVEKHNQKSCCNQRNPNVVVAPREGMFYCESCDCAWWYDEEGQLHGSEIPSMCKEDVVKEAQHELCKECKKTKGEITSREAIYKLSGESQKNLDRMHKLRTNIKIKRVKEKIEVERLGGDYEENHPYIVVYAEDMISEKPRFFMLPLHAGFSSEGDELHQSLDYIEGQTTNAFFKTIQEIYKIYNAKYFDIIEEEIGYGEAFAERFNAGVFDGEDEEE